MNEKKSIILGVLLFAVAVGLNTNHALNGYGVKDNKLHLEVLAQSNNSGGGTNGGGGGTSGDSSSGDSNNSGGTNIYYYKHLKGKPGKCNLEVYVDATGNIYASKGEAGAGVKLEKKTISGTEENCPDKGDGCTVYSCHQTKNTQ